MLTDGPEIRFSFTRDKQADLLPAAAQPFTGHHGLDTVGGIGRDL